MRKLNGRQKRLLQEWYGRAEKPLGMSFGAEDLPDEVYTLTVELGDFETINSEITNYLQDLENNGHGVGGEGTLNEMAKVKPLTLNLQKLPV